MIRRPQRMKWRAKAGAHAHLTVERGNDAAGELRRPRHRADISSLYGAYLPTAATRKQMHSFPDSIKENKKRIKRSGDVAPRDQLSTALQ